MALKLDHSNVFQTGGRSGLELCCKHGQLRNKNLHIIQKLVSRLSRFSLLAPQFEISKHKSTCATSALTEDLFIIAARSIDCKYFQRLKGVQAD